MLKANSGYERLCVLFVKQTLCGAALNVTTAAGVQVPVTVVTSSVPRDVPGLQTPNAL